MLFIVSRYEEEKEDELIVLNQEEQTLQTFEGFAADVDAQLMPSKNKVKIKEKKQQNLSI